MSITLSNNNISSSDALTVNNRTFSEVAFSGDYEDLKNKPNVSSGGTLIDSWHDDNGNWCRQYDDGWIEQGGLVANGSSVTLHAPYSDTNFKILFSPTGIPQRETLMISVSKTTSAISINQWGADRFNWYTQGY